MKQSNTFKRLGTGVILTAFLVCCFLGTSLSLRPAYAEWEAAPANSLNNGVPVIDLAAINKVDFEPGATIQQKFSIKNDSSTVVNYRFYLADANDENKIQSLSGAFASTLEVSILEPLGGDKYRVLASGTMADMKRDTIAPVVKYDYVEQKYMPGVLDELGTYGTKNLILQIHYPETAGNVPKDTAINFVLGLDFQAVNPNSSENNEG